MSKILRMFFHNSCHVTIERCHIDISYYKHDKAPVRYIWLNIHTCLCVDKLWLQYQFLTCLCGLFTRIHHFCFIVNRVLKGIGTTSKHVTAYFYEYAVWLFQGLIFLIKLVKCPNPSENIVLKEAPVKRKGAVRVDGRHWKCHCCNNWIKFKTRLNRSFANSQIYI